jgi:hypothetical protein
MDDDVPWRSPSEKIAWVQWNFPHWAELWVVIRACLVFAMCISTDFWIVLFWKAEGLQMKLFEPVDTDHVIFCDSYI